MELFAKQYKRSLKLWIKKKNFNEGIFGLVNYESSINIILHSSKKDWDQIKIG
jgi:hypothetical protein